MKLVFLLFICIGCAFATSAHDDELQCSLKVCGTDLLNFEHFDFGKLIKKIQVGTFCIKNCTPPVVHEFFQSIIFAIRKRIPGLCVGNDCVDANRFVALGECVHKRSWPMIECSKKLIDLAQIALEPKSKDAARNLTCSIVSDTVQCFEENLQKCGPQPFSLVKEIIGEVVHVSITAFCHPSYSKNGFFRKYKNELGAPIYDPPAEWTEAPTSHPSVESTEAPPVPAKAHYVKAYHDNSALSLESSVTVLVSLVCLVLSLNRYR